MHFCNYAIFSKNKKTVFLLYFEDTKFSLKDNQKKKIYSFLFSKYGIVHNIVHQFRQKLKSSTWIQTKTQKQYSILYDGA